MGKGSIDSYVVAAILGQVARGRLRQVELLVWLWSGSGLALVWSWFSFLVLVWRSLGSA